MKKVAPKAINKKKIAKAMKETEQQMDPALNKLKIVPKQETKPKGQLQKNKNQPLSNLKFRHQPLGIRLLKQVQERKKIAAVIVTFSTGQSYDHLFTTVQQKSEEGTQVVVYSCDCIQSLEILLGFKGQAPSQIIKQMIQHINGVDPDCVVFNWQCCSFYGFKRFSEGRNSVMEFIKLLIGRGHIAMFSDFSLKALINEWDPDVLGPKPFVQYGKYSGQFTLQFDPQKLRQCPSAQLQIVGEMASQGHCTLHGMDQTIVYGVDESKIKHDFYKLQVLTVAAKFQKSTKYPIKKNEKPVTVGHVLLTYKSGGGLLTSMGHWVELMKLDTSQKTLFDVAAKEFGQQQVNKMKKQYNALDKVTKKSYIMEKAANFVKSKAPCKLMKRI